MASPTVNSPSRTLTASTEDDTPLGDDPSETTKLLHERLQAYKHACGYIEEYIKSSEKMQTAHSKEYEKVLKTINNPLKEGEQFDHNPGGIAGMFDTMRTNTQAISNAHTQTATSLKGSVLPVFERLHAEIKNKQKELAKGVGKGSKAVDKARGETQKHVDLLASSTSSFDMFGGKDASSDPYIVQRGINHRLHRQFQEENNHRQDMLSVQNNFSQFERHIVETMQQGMGLFNQTMNNQADQQKALYSQVIATVQAVEPLHEWDLFVTRNANVLIDPRTPAKTLSNASFPNQNHKSTVPLCQGALERKQGLLRKFDNSFYVITPARFLHEFKSDDDLSKDPSPELSLYLPDCVTGGLNGNLFSVKGKDVSKGKLGNAMSTTKEYEFRTTTGTHAESWYNVIIDLIGKRPGDTLSPTSPTSPNSLTSREAPNAPPITTDVAPATAEQETGTTPSSANPLSATSTTANQTPTTTASPTNTTTAPGSAV